MSKQGKLLLHLKYLSTDVAFFTEVSSVIINNIINQEFCQKMYT